MSENRLHNTKSLPNQFAQKFAGEMFTALKLILSTLQIMARSHREPFPYDILGLIGPVRPELNLQKPLAVFFPSL